LLGDVFSGKLVNPKVGAWAWYDITSGKAESGGAAQLGMMRLAIVDEEKVKGKQGYWLEMEYVPSIGYPSIYKMLLTGPADDPANVHKVFRREGNTGKEEVPLPSDAEKAAAPDAAKSDRKLVGDEDVKTPGGTLHAQHYQVTEGGESLDVWIDESVSPMGIVQMKSGDGALVLRDHGNGGREARSVIDDAAPKPNDSKGGVKVDVRVEKPSNKKDAVKSEGKPSKGGS
jgi:hypothetical protein